jgi:hypothetical protein
MKNERARKKLDSLIIIQLLYIYMTPGKNTSAENENDIDLLSQNYKEMNETGKEKLKQVAGQILEIYRTVNESNERSKEK